MSKSNRGHKQRTIVESRDVWNKIGSKLAHFHLGIRGWCAFENLYVEMVQAFDRGQFLEVGSFCGRSAAFLATEIKNQKKSIDLFCVDVWENGAKGLPPETYIKESPITLFLRNTKIVEDVIQPIHKSSVEAAKIFNDESLDFVFIDGSHEYEDVVQDIEIWAPKVKKGGVLAGDDYIWESVSRAVSETLRGFSVGLANKKTPSGWPSKYWLWRKI